MTISAIAKVVRDEKTAYLIRYRIGSAEDGRPAQYDAKPWVTGGKKKRWVILDLFTASAMAVVYENLKPKNQQMFDRQPIGKLAEFCLSNVR